MGNAGILKVTLTSDQANFVAGMRNAKQSLKEFGESTKDGGKEVEAFNAHMLTSRHSIQSFAIITGESAGLLGHMVHGFMALPGPIGIVVGAMLVLREAFNKSAEQAKELEEYNAKLAKTLTDVGKFQGKFHLFEGVAAEAKANFDEITKALVEAQARWKAGNRQDGDSARIDSMKEEQLKAADLIEAYDRLNMDMEQIKDNDFTLKMTTEANSMERLQGHAEDLKDKLNALNQAFLAAPENSKAAQNFKHDWQAVSLEIKKVDEEIRDFGAVKIKLIDPQELRNNQLKDLKNFAEGMFDKVRLPQEILESQLKELGAALSENLMSPETYRRAVDLVNQEFEKTQNKTTKEAKTSGKNAENHGFLVGDTMAQQYHLGTQSGMEKKQDVTNKLLDTISKAISKDSVNQAVAG